MKDGPSPSCSSPSHLYTPPPPPPTSRCGPRTLPVSDEGAGEEKSPSPPFKTSSRKPTDQTRTNKPQAPPPSPPLANHAAGREGGTTRPVTQDPPQVASNRDVRVDPSFICSSRSEVRFRAGAENPNSCSRLLVVGAATDCVSVSSCSQIWTTGED